MSEERGLTLIYEPYNLLLFFVWSVFHEAGVGATCSADSSSFAEKVPGKGNRASDNPPLMGTFDQPTVRPITELFFSIEA